VRNTEREKILTSSYYIFAGWDRVYFQSDVKIKDLQLAKRTSLQEDVLLNLQNPSRTQPFS